MAGPWRASRRVPGRARSPRGSGTYPLVRRGGSRYRHVFHLYPAHHLPHDHLDVLIVDVDTLQPVDFLNLVDQVFLQLLLAEYSQDVVWIARSIHQRLTRLDPLSFLYRDVNTAGQSVL